MQELQRESVELYFEHHWIHQVRHGLGGRSPIAAAHAAAGGDALARAKLAAVVRMREQIGNRRSAAGLYQGYPFDRLRRRLGLELVVAGSVDPGDWSCAGPEDLDRLDAKTLDDATLLDAANSAAGLRDDARTARLAAELLSRRPLAAQVPALAALISPLLRQAMSRGDHDGGLSCLDAARPLADAQTSATLDVWRAEILARAGRSAEGLSIYERLITPDAHGAALSLDAAETMLDNGHLDEAQSLLKLASRLARGTGRRWIERRAAQLLSRIS